MRWRTLACLACLTPLVLNGCEGATEPEVDHAAPSLAIVSGDEQVGVAGEPLPEPLVVVVKDWRGRPVPNYVVNFRVVEGDGDVFAGAAQTNLLGVAQELWTLGDPGPQRVEVRAVSSLTGRPQVFGVFTAIAEGGEEPPLDEDGDGVPDDIDNCPGFTADDQTDHDGDGAGNPCDPDDDGDGRHDAVDACAQGEVGWTSDAQTDGDGDGCRDAGEDPDDDHDGVADDADQCPADNVGWTSNPETDADGDGCPDPAGPDHDGDGTVDTLDPDDDNDGLADALDSCAQGALGWTSDAQSDVDSDGCRDSDEDANDDNDSFPDDLDSCPRGLIGWAAGPDTDSDTDGCRDDFEDADDDNDGVIDAIDNCRLVPNPDQADADGDGVGDVCDMSSLVEVDVEISNGSLSITRAEILAT